jgi:hypothetical protein
MIFAEEQGELLKFRKVIGRLILMPFPFLLMYHIVKIRLSFPNGQELCKWNAAIHHGTLFFDFIFWLTEL